MKYGLTANEQTFAFDGKQYEIPNAEVELSTLFRPEEQLYHQTFPAHDTEPFAAHKALEKYYLKLNWQLSKIKKKFEDNAENLRKMQRNLQAPEAAKLLADDVKEYNHLVSEARQMAVDKLAFVEEVRNRATILPEPSNSDELMVRTITQQTLRQELAARYKRLGSTHAERTNNALHSIAKTGDLNQDLMLLQAVRQNTLFEPTAGTLQKAEKRLIDEYYPWINDLGLIAKAVEKWTANRMTYQALPALKKALPFGLTPERIEELTTGKPEPENLTKKMSQAA